MMRLKDVALEKSKGEQNGKREGWDREGRRETQEGGDMGIYVYV